MGKLRKELQRREGYWQHELMTFVPWGLNTRDELNGVDISAATVNSTSSITSANDNSNYTVTDNNVTATVDSYHYYHSQEQQGTNDVDVV